ncbi:MAG TPA: threonine ammonia-lyase [Thermoanaerobaculia bacterium]|nr:threonine ammonia-lyase [Thermoanaerobaculia bacterium]
MASQDPSGAATDAPPHEAVTLSAIRDARQRLGDAVGGTPCRLAHSADRLGVDRVHLKFENLHHTGSFKERGALNKLLSLGEDDRRRGVITASAGNHAQALAYHARRLDIRATVVMPEATPLIKVSSTRRHGAEVVLHGATFDDAVEEALRRRDEQGQVLVHAFNDPAVVTGQGTLGLELLEQVPDLATVVVPIGGGGVISGTAVALKEQRPGVRVIGVEAVAAPSARASRDAGRIVRIPTQETLADGIAIKRVGEVTFPLLERYVDDIVLVDDEEIAAAILLLLEREKTLVEGAGAVGIAALLAGRIAGTADGPVAVVLCGGNIDVNILSRIIDRGLVEDGRLARLVVTVRDRPGMLARLTAIVARLGANVLESVHSRAFADISVGEVAITLTLETRGREHVEELVAALETEGHRVDEERG